MNVFSPRTTVQDEEAIVDFSGDVKTISDCLIHGRVDPSKLSLPLRTVAQRGYTVASLAATDLIAASIRVPIFSNRFVDVMGEALSGEMEFIACGVECEGRIVECFAGHILRELPLVDASKSEFRKLISGGSMLLRAVYHSSFDSEFLIARDVESKARFVVSERFKSLCEANALNIEFGKPV
jgi:hypothetical protein